MGEQQKNEIYWQSDLIAIKAREWSSNSQTLWRGKAAVSEGTAFEGRKGF